MQQALALLQEAASIPPTATATAVADATITRTHALMEENPVVREGLALAREILLRKEGVDMDSYLVLPIFQRMRAQRDGLKRAIENGDTAEISKLRLAWNIMYDDRKEIEDQTFGKGFVALCMATYIHNSGHSGAVLGFDGAVVEDFVRSFINSSRAVIIPWNNLISQAQYVYMIPKDKRVVVTEIPDDLSNHEAIEIIGSLKSRSAAMKGEVTFIIPNAEAYHRVKNNPDHPFFNFLNDIVEKKDCSSELKTKAKAPLCEGLFIAVINTYLSNPYPLLQRREHLVPASPGLQHIPELSASCRSEESHHIRFRHGRWIGDGFSQKHAYRIAYKAYSIGSLS